MIRPETEVLIEKVCTEMLSERHNGQELFSSNYCLSAFDSRRLAYLLLALAINLQEDSSQATVTGICVKNERSHKVRESQDWCGC